MVAKIRPREEAVVLKFGGGLHTRAAEDEINEREAAAGQNFLLDLENRELRNRPAFDLIGTAPNGSEIRGGISLLQADGTVKCAFQAGDTVYEWDGLSSLTNIATVDSTAKLRGRWPGHQWTLDDKVLITDLALMEQVKEWDGSTFQDVSFTDENDSGFGDFFARYCQVSNERALFSHVKDSGSTTRHMMVGAKRGDYTNITITNRPSSSLSEEDPFFLLAPDLKPINGHVEAFGVTVISTEKGQVFNLTGSSAADFAFADFYAGSYASGEESIAYIGNDVVYGRSGRIESVRDTDRFGDSEANDLTSPIADTIGDYDGWTCVYNSRLNRAYFFPTGQSEVWVVQTTMIGGEVSPWMRWTTQHAMAFRPTFAMNMLDPQDGLEYVFMGDASGNIYRMEGSGAGDAGSANIQTQFRSKLFSAPLDAQAYDIEGWIKYRKGEAATVTLTFMHAGQTVFNEAITVSIPAITNRPVYGGGIYYSDGNYYGTAFAGRLVRQRIGVPGQANEFQVQIDIDGTTDFQINEIGLRFKAASA